jgi:alpha-tubulin suppressor-like RCC1 family protein
MPNGIKQFHPEDSDAFGIHGLELESYHIEKRESQLFDDFDGPVVDVVANATTFTALTSVGTVYTWGDGRIIDRLGRGVTFDR